MILGLLLIKSNSLYTSILGHIFNNAIALTLGYYLTRITKNLEQIVDQGPIIPSGIQLIATFIVLGGFALFSGIILYLLIKKFPTAETVTDIELEDMEEKHTHQEERRITWLPIYIIFAIFIYTNYRFLFY